jgi:hypothetical protein
VSRKSVAKEKMFCIERTVDLEGRSYVTDGNLVDRGKWSWPDILTLVWQGYHVLELVLFSRIESCFAMIG